MANGPRTIYSRRQRLAPGQYDTPFADFLDNLSGYVNQFQQNQLALGQQQFQRLKYNDAKEQQKYTNELNVFKLLPQDQRLNAMSTSKIPDIKAIGDKGKEQRQAFTDQINEVYTDNVGDSSAILTGLEGLLSNPDIRSNETRTSQIQDHIDREKPKVIRQQINTWAQENPSDPRVKAIVMQSKTDPDGALRALTPARTTISTNQERVYNPFTKEFGFATDAEIAKAKATETKEDDLIPTSGAPESQDNTLSGPQLQKLYTDIDQVLKDVEMGQIELSPERVKELEDRRTAILDQRLSLSGASNGPTLKLPLQTTTQESTRTIPGW